MRKICHLATDALRGAGPRHCADPTLRRPDTVAGVAVGLRPVLQCRMDKAIDIHSKVLGWLEDACRGEGNTLGGEATEPAWGVPIVGVAAGDDPIFDEYKTVVGPVHWTPAEAFRTAFPGSSPANDQLSVISWILPQTETTKADNRSESRVPSERWVRARVYGERFNDRLRAGCADYLSGLGYRAVAPMRLPEFRVERAGPFGRMSTWSERHAAYACGLGTFGRCDGLITPVGKAIRAGSVVVEARMEPTARQYTDHHAYCLHFSTGNCEACARRCPVGAISERGHDKELCAEYLQDVTRPYANEHYGFDGYGCGLCQTGVPCESGIPAVLGPGA